MDNTCEVMICGWSIYHETDMSDLTCFVKPEIMFSHLKGKRMSLLPNFVQKTFLHWWYGCLSSCRWKHLNALHPDVSPQGQTDDVKVFNPIVEGASKVSEYYRGHGQSLCWVNSILDCSNRYNINIPFLPERTDGSTLITPSTSARNNNSIRSHSDAHVHTLVSM